MTRSGPLARFAVIPLLIASVGVTGLLPPLLAGTGQARIPRVATCGCGCGGTGRCCGQACCSAGPDRQIPPTGATSTALRCVDLYGVTPLAGRFCSAREPGRHPHMLFARGRELPHPLTLQGQQVRIQT